MVSHTKGPNSKPNFLKNTDSVLSQSLEYPKYRDAVIIVCVVCILISFVGGLYLLIRNTELPLEKVKNVIDTEKARLKKTSQEILLKMQSRVEKKETKESVDPVGNLKIDTLDISSKFIKNAKKGKLFVITGRIKNEYSDVRSYVKITGKLYTKGKVISQTETVFCGNVLSDIELSNLDLTAIKKRLSNRLGDNRSNIQIKPGQELPFMIVFSNLPDNLEEFAVEVTGSSPSDPEEKK